MKWLKRILGIEKREEMLAVIVEELEYIREDIKVLVDFIGESPTHCDKCDNFHYPDYLQPCVKCDNTGIVKHKTLMSWPWGE